MNKFHKIATALAIALTLGLTCAIMIIKGMPDSFNIDWEDDE